MPGIVGDLATTVFAWMLADVAAILPDDDAFGIGVDLDRAADRAGVDRVFVVYLLLSNRTMHVFDAEPCWAWKPSKRPR